MRKVAMLTKDNFDNHFEHEDFMVLDFSAPWCEPCQSFTLLLEEMATLFPAVFFGVVDVSKEEELAHAFNVRSVPTTVILRYQTAVFIQSGVLTKQELRRLLTEAQALTVDEVQKEVKDA